MEESLFPVAPGSRKRCAFWRKRSGGARNAFEERLSPRHVRKHIPGGVEKLGPEVSFETAVLTISEIDL